MKKARNPDEDEAGPAGGELSNPRMMGSFNIKTPKVYVVQEVFKKEGGISRPLFNLSPAREYGEIKILLPPGGVMLHPIPMVRELDMKLK